MGRDTRWSFWRLSQDFFLIIHAIRPSLRYVLGGITLFVSLCSLLTLIYIYGFVSELDLRSSQIFWWDKVCLISLGYHVVKFFLEYVLNFFRISYLRHDFFEALLTLFALIYLMLFACEVLDLGARILLRWSVFLFFILDQGRRISAMSKIPFSSPTLFALSFVLLIVVGTLFLMMPNITVESTPMPFFDALFTSISSSCVTGLTIADTATYFSFKGQLVIMFLIQLGGLNIISFAMLFSFLLSGKMHLKHQTLVQRSLDVTSGQNTKMLFRRIILSTLIIELLGVVALFFAWDKEVFESFSQRLFYSIFHSISAFNNAGFSLFTDGFADVLVRYNYVVHFFLAVLIILGSLGFPSVQDVFSKKRLRLFFRGQRYPLEVNTRLVLKATSIVLVLGMVVFFAAEYQRFEGEGFWGLLSDSFFQSVVTRTAGFNTVDIGLLSAPTLVMMMMMMFVGASPGSTGGGVKITTLTILFLAANSILRGRRRIQYANRSIPFSLFNRASIVLFLSSAFVFVCFLILTILEPNIPPMSLLFEEVSAFATVGLSTGITDQLSVWARGVIMLSMFLGRVGIITLGFSVLRRTISSDYRYPEEKVQVG